MPVILDISAEESLPQGPGVSLPGTPPSNEVGWFGEEIRQRRETPYSLRVIALKEIVSHPLHGKAELQRMGSTGQKGVVVKLEGIPIVMRKSAVQARRRAVKPPVMRVLGLYPPGKAPREGSAEAGLTADRLIVNHGIPVVTKPRAY